MTPQDVANQLEQIASAEDFPGVSAELTASWISMGTGQEAVERVLRFMETNSGIDFGMPGALVHFVERFYKHGYEELLLDSLERKPTTLTTWMLNRIINATNEPDVRQRFVEAMERASVNADADLGTKQAAEHFLERLAP